MKIEYELRILDIDTKNVVTKLEALGARKIHDEVLQKRYIMDFHDGRLDRDQGYLRLRQVGDLHTECTFKRRIDNTSIKNAEEINIEISDIEDAKELFERLGLAVVKYQENKRLTYERNGVTFDIDTWPGKNTYIEFESDNEQAVWDAVAEMGFNKTDCIFTAGVALHRLLGYTDEQMKNIRFNNENHS